MKDLRKFLYGPWAFMIIAPISYFLAWQPIEMWYFRALAVMIVAQLGLEIYIRTRK